MASQQFVMPLVTTPVEGGSHAEPYASDYYFIFLSPEDLGRPHARGLGDALDREDVRACILALQLFVDLADRLSNTRARNARVSALLAAARVPCERGTGVLFHAVFSSRATVTMVRNERTDAKDSKAAEDDPDDPDMPPGGGGVVRGRRRPHPTNQSLAQHEGTLNIADLLHHVANMQLQRRTGGTGARADAGGGGGGGGGGRRDAPCH
jgi:hypothetical protein